MSKNGGGELIKALIKIVAVGAVGGAALIAGTNKAGQTLLNEEKLKKLSDNKKH